MKSLLSSGLAAFSMGSLSEAIDLMSASSNSQYKFYSKKKVDRAARKRKNKLARKARAVNRKGA